MMLSPHTLLTMCFAIFRVPWPVSGIEECPEKSTCHSQTSGPSMLQVATQMSKTPEKSVRKTIFGVPVLTENSIGPSYSGDEEKDWVLVIKQGQETEAVFHRVCQAVNCTGE